MQPISTCLWFDGKAEQAANFYVSLFENSKIGVISKGPDGRVVVVTFSLDGRQFTALNGGPKYHFTPAVSLVVNVDTQQELDRFWDRLSEGGKPGRCGWLEDRYGLSWQVLPTNLSKLMTGSAGQSARVMQAVMKMDKLNMTLMQEAYDEG